MSENWIYKFCDVYVPYILIFCVGMSCGAVLVIL